jgi:hypothetical protein
VIILDTNVISEIFKPTPERCVIEWMTSLTDDVAITAIALAELLAGVRRLPDGRRRDVLVARIDAAIAPYRGRLARRRVLRSVPLTPRLPPSVWCTTPRARPGMSKISCTRAYRCSTHGLLPDDRQINVRADVAGVAVTARSGDAVPSGRCCPVIAIRFETRSNFA